jgi:glycosyltransferase involved in cell wall biosynthesis
LVRIGIDGLLLWGRYAGVEHAIANLIRSLPATGAHEYVAFVDREFDESGWSRPDLTFVHAAVASRSRVRRAWAQQRWLPRAIAEAAVDVFHAPGYVMPLRCPVPAVVTVHDVIAISHPHLCRRSNVWHYRLLLPRSLRRARLIIATSEAVKREVIARCDVDASKIRVVPLGIDEHFFAEPHPAARDAVRERYGLPERFFLFAGRWEPKKNLPALLRAYEIFRAGGRGPHKLVIAGDLGWNYRPELALIDQLRLRGGVVLTGYVPTGDLAAIYSMAEALVFPSVVEGFGLPPLEAMACGTPAIISDAPALVEVAGDAAVTVPGADPEGLCGVMAQIAGDRALRDELATRGRERAAHFRWSAAAEATVRVYEEAAG